MKLMLSLIGAVENLDLEEGVSFANNPEESRLVYPFGNRDPEPNTRKRKAEEESGSQKGTGTFSPSPDPKCQKFSRKKQFWNSSGSVKFENVLPDNLFTK